MSPKDYFQTCVLKKVLVEFEVVFGSSSTSAQHLTFPEAPEPLRTDRDTSLAESFGTFGHKGRGDSVDSKHEDDDGWSYTLSTYGIDDEEDPLGYRPNQTPLITSPPIPDIPEPLPPIPSPAVHPSGN